MAYNPAAKKEEETVKLDAPASVITSVPEDEIDFSNITEADILTNAAIVAAPMGFDTSLDIRSKILNKQYYYKWMNRVGGSQQRYQQALAMGFVNAEFTDFTEIDPSMKRDGTIISGDLILMKMPKAKAFGNMKANLLRSEQIVASKKDIKQVTKDAYSGVNAPADFLRDKVKIFSTTQ